MTDFIGLKTIDFDGSFQVDFIRLFEKILTFSLERANLSDARAIFIIHPGEQFHFIGAISLSCENFQYSFERERCFFVCVDKTKLFFCLRSKPRAHAECPNEIKMNGGKKRSKFYCTPLCTLNFQQLRSVGRAPAPTGQPNKKW